MAAAGEEWRGMAGHREGARWRGVPAAGKGGAAELVAGRWRVARRAGGREE